MLTIRNAQLAVFAEIAQRRFEEALVAHVREHFAGLCRELDAPGVLARVRAATLAAARHGISLEVDVCRYVEIAFAFGDGFEHEPWARAALAVDPSPDVKIRVLVARAVERGGVRQGGGRPPEGNGRRHEVTPRPEGNGRTQ